MANILVTPQNVRDTGRRIKGHNNQANSYLDQITESIGRLRANGGDGWESDAATAFFLKFDELRARIERHRVVIDAYGNHLDKAAADYEQSDDYAKAQSEPINVNA